MKRVSIIFWLITLGISGCKDKAENPLPLSSTGFEIFYIYPNPNNGFIMIGVNNESNQDYQLLLFDPEGVKIYSDAIPKKSKRDLAYNLKEKRAGNGIFTAILQTPTTTFTKKIIVE